MSEGYAKPDVLVDTEWVAQHQDDFAKRLKQAFPENGSMPSFNNRALDPRLQGRGRTVMPSPAGTPTEQGEKLAAEKEKMAQELEAIQRQMQDSAQSLAAGQPDGINQVSTDSFLLVPASHGKDKHGIFGTEPTHSQPGSIR